MSACKRSKMACSPPEESREEKQSRFIEKFIEQRNWTDEDVLAFIVVEFDGNVEDINWVIKTALERLSYPKKIIEMLMKNGIELQVLNDLGQTAVHLAAIRGYDSTTEMLLEYSGYENVSDNEGLTYFHIACMHGCYESMQKFIGQGVDINLPYYKDGFKETPLSLCIKNRYTLSSQYTLELLLENGADYKLLDGWDEDPLKYLKFLSQGSECIDKLKLLADPYFEELLENVKNAGTLENRCDCEGFTYLHAACICGNIKMVQKFIDQKSDLDLIWRLSNGTNESPLTLATEHEHIEIVEMLLKNRANPNVKLLGRNPLHVYFKYSQDESEKSRMLNLLISYKCDVNEKDSNGHSPLYLCFRKCCDACNGICSCSTERGFDTHIIKDLHGNHKDLQILLKNKSDVNEVFAETYSHGQSILHSIIVSEICKSNQVTHDGYIRKNTVGIKFVKTILKYGADVNAKDDDGNSPLHLAVLSNNLDVVKALLKRGADVQSVNFSKFDYEYDQSSNLWFDEIIIFFLILNCLIEKGYKMDESSCLTALKFLVKEVILNKPNIEESSKLLVGSLTQLRLFLVYVQNSDNGDDQFGNYQKEVLAQMIHGYLQFVEKGNAFMTAEAKDCLQQLQKIFTLKEKHALRYNAKISLEIEKLKKIRIKDDVSLLDVCASGPQKRYRLLKNSDFWTIINSKKLKKTFDLSSEIIKSYIVTCFVRNFFANIGLKYLMLLTQDELPLLCCENLVQYMSNEDILYLCQIFTNKV